MANITLPSWMTGRKAPDKSNPVDMLTRMEPAATRIAPGAMNDATVIGNRASSAMQTVDGSLGGSGGMEQADPSLINRIRNDGSGASKGLPIIGKMPLGKQLSTLGTIASVLGVLALIFIGLNVVESKKSTAGVQAAGQLGTLMQTMAIGASQAQQGVAGSFKSVRESRDAYVATLTSLAEGAEAVQTEAQREQVSDLKKRWEKIAPQVEDILKNEKVLSSLSQSVRKINDLTPRLQALTDQLSLQAAGTGQREQAQASQLSMLTQRIAKNMNGLLAEEIDPEAAFGLGKDVANFRDTVKGLRDGSEALRLTALRDPAARATLDDVAKAFADVESGVSDVLKSTPGLVAAKQGARAVVDSDEAMLKASAKLTDSYSGTSNPGTLALILAGVLGTLALATLALIAKVLNDDAKRRRLEAEAENRRNQEAILRLLNEMGNLADGDLTVHASVTEDVTGAIADSINFTVDELRGVVTGINSTTDQVNSATQEAQRISSRMAEASQRQSGEIEKASTLVLSMAQSINDVSASAAQSARVAQTSLSVAEQGAVAVQNQIASMNEIRGQIQETSKRIKRLGESSQEIGHITELIGDITQQTNVLALNAAIQAASAGDAGRGFSVVAEEVQRLAERSGEATKQIEAIVKTIQADTQDAVIAMERSTQGVVEGTKLSDAAGNALSEIRRVSRELADLISNISGQTQRQATNVSEVTRGMQDILRVSEDSTKSSQLTTTQIDKLTSLARSLRESVAGFKV
jgi:twitching motility protein PilJ